MSVMIHNREYITVAERVKEAGDSFLGLNTEVLFTSPVVVKATVTIAHINGQTKTFTGISAANPDKSIEKMSPYEVAETSAVGRALGFAGYGMVDGIATADEMVKAEQTTDSEPVQDLGLGECVKCGAPNIKYKTGRVGCSKFCWKV